MIRSCGYSPNSLPRITMRAFFTCVLLTLAPLRPMYAQTTGTAEVNGTTLYYEVQGTGEPLVLLQGANFDLRMWDEQFKLLADHYRVIRYDVRGFGRSGPRDTAPYQAHKDLRALLDHLDVERAHMVGLSLGGRIALDFALESPDRVRSLVLAGPGLSGFEWDRNSFDWATPIVEAAQRGDSVHAAEIWLKSPYMAPAMENPLLADRLRALATENARVWVHADSEVPLDPSAVNRLGSIRAPTLVLLGGRDVPDIRRIAALLREHIPHVEYVEFAGIGHVINLEASERFNQVVLEFLRR